eukprot:4132567-Alexandrium_andersonii.AAC.1
MLLDANLEHPRLRQLGAAKSRIHRTVAKTTAQFLNQADHEVRFERAIPNLGRWKQDESDQWQWEDGV